MLVVHRGRVVHEFGDTQKPVNLYSGRKSALGVLLGMEVDAGRLKPQATLAELGINDKQGLSEVEKSATVQQLMQSRSGVYHPAAYETQLSALDWARVGLLMARGGLWQGQRLLSEAWVAESTKMHSVVPPGWSGYGYLWWTPLRAFDFWTRTPGQVFFAHGNHGQVLWVDRARDIVVVHNTDHRRMLRASPELGQLYPLLQHIFAAQP